MKANKKQKILYIVTNSDLGGISKYLLEITRYLPEHIEPYYIMATSGYLSDELEKLGISKEQIFFVPMTNSITDIKTHIKSYINVIKITKNIKPDIIHANATTGSIVSAIAGLFSGVPVLYGGCLSSPAKKASASFWTVASSLLSLYGEVCIFRSATSFMVFGSEQARRRISALTESVKRKNSVFKSV